MKFILLLSLLSTFNLEAAQNSWSELKPGERYRLNQEITLQSKEKAIHIKKGTKVKLIESTQLNMIKVHLQRYEVDDCIAESVESDLELVNIKGNKQTSVGVNMSKGCILEVFVEKKDFQKQSLVL